MRPERTIQRYANRRLYDPAQARYITLADLRKLVRQKVAFNVVDHRRQTDITRHVLLQAILDDPHSGKAGLTRGFLERVIRKGTR